MPLRLVGVNIDITERKQAEAALQQQTALVNFSHDAIIALDANRVITTWNTGAEEIYGWTRAEAVGKVLHQLLQTESAVSIADIDRILARDGRWDGKLVHTAGREADHRRKPANPPAGSRGSPDGNSGG